MSDKRREMIDRGDKAKELLADPAVSGTIAALDAAVRQQLAKASTPDQAFHAACMYQATRTFESVLHAAIAQGVEAGKRLLAEQQQLQRKREDDSRVRDYQAAAKVARDSFDQQRNGSEA